MSKPSTPDLRAFVETELNEAIDQRNEWRERLVAAQQQAQQAQQAAQQAQAMIFKAEGACEALAAIVAKFDEGKEEPAPG